MIEAKKNKKGVWEVKDSETKEIFHRTLDEDSARFAAKAKQAKLDLVNQPVAQRVQVSDLPASQDVLARVTAAVAASKPKAKEIETKST